MRLLGTGTGLQEAAFASDGEHRYPVALQASIKATAIAYNGFIGVAGRICCLTPIWSPCSRRHFFGSVIAPANDTSCRKSGGVGMSALGQEQPLDQWCLGAQRAVFGLC